MLKVSEVVKYIEQKNNIKLMDYQKDILKHIVTGDIIYTPRCCGRSILYSGYADYLKERIADRVDYSVNPLDFDKVYTIKEIRDDNKLYGGNICGKMDQREHENKSAFDREYNCNY